MPGAFPGPIHVAETLTRPPGEFGATCDVCDAPATIAETQEITRPDRTAREVTYYWCSACHAECNGLEAAP